MKKLDLSLYLVTDQRIPWEKCLASIRQAVLGGVSLVQLREKNCSKDEIREKARDLLALLKPMGVPLIINDHVDIARDTGAQGVHLGKRDCDVKEARSILGDNAIVGLSIEGIGDLERSDFGYCDYISASPVFPTTSKDDAAKPMGVEGLVKLRNACPVPLVAIGGINSTNLKLIARVEIDGLCVVSSILCSKDSEAAARHLKRIFLTSRSRIANG